jgi:UDP-N-acetylmuramate dehydrogenase
MIFGYNISMKPYNTFGIDVKARYFTSFKSVDSLMELFHLYPELLQVNRLVLGGGSNILLTKDFDGYVLKNDIEGIEKIREDEDYVWLKSGAGVSWHQLVLYAVERGWGGMENLSLIPGNTGAAPMQNIGAYGVELKDIFHSLEAYHINDKAHVTFHNNDCAFGYRESVFKRQYKNEFIITSVTLCLRKKPEFHIQYGAIQQQLEKNGVKDLSVRAVSEAVIQIRSDKLPDPKKIGNAGSFFKNPSVSSENFEALKMQFPELVSYKNADNTYKLAAGWLIEQCGWKGYRKGDAGCYPLQALVLVNYDKATGAEILALSQEIQSSVNAKFGVQLEREVNLIG